jgi:hypothetical protein
MFSQPAQNRSYTIVERIMGSIGYIRVSTADQTGALQ